MALTTSEVMEDLQAFMYAFAKTVARMYGPEVLPALFGCTTPMAQAARAEDCDFSETRLWRTVHRMAVFGLEGVPMPGIGQGMLDDDEVDVELFLREMLELKTLMARNGYGDLPHFVKQAVETAVARHVLEGGTRPTDWDADGDVSGVLTVRDIAQLADMDERSVRNACNPKLPDALVTQTSGKRTVVTREEAKRWLQGRKGYVPLRRDEPDKPRTETLQLELEYEAARLLQDRARALGMTLSAYVALQLAQPLPPEAAKQGRVTDDRTGSRASRTETGASRSAAKRPGNKRQPGDRA